MKIYTRTGDDGSTGLFGGERVSKASGRVEAYGTVDELNAALGVVRALSASSRTDPWLHRIQGELFVLGAMLAVSARKAATLGLPALDGSAVSALERAIDELTSELPALKSFILPTGSPRAALLHQARTVCRRAERTLIAAADEMHEAPLAQAHGQGVVYLNRLADFLFVLARHANHEARVGDIEWHPKPRSPPS